MPVSHDADFVQSVYCCGFRYSGYSGYLCHACINQRWCNCAALVGAPVLMLNVTYFPGNYITKPQDVSNTVKLLQIHEVHYLVPVIR